MNIADKNFIKELASGYTTRTEFALAQPAAYQRMRRAGLILELCPHMPIPRRWTLEELREIAANYETRSEWGRSDPGSYQALRRKGRDNLDRIAPPSLRKSAR